MLEPRAGTALGAPSARGGGIGSKAEPAPGGPATAGAQPRSPLSEAATVSAFALGAAAGLESAPSATPRPAPARSSPPPKALAGVRVFREGPDEVYLHPLRAGVQVIAGTVLGHVGTGTSAREQRAKARRTSSSRFVPPGPARR